jgi:hypothetical protein
MCALVVFPRLLTPISIVLLAADQVTAGHTFVAPGANIMHAVMFELSVG